MESAINALEVHGLDRCGDHGIDGFKRYVALAATVARNIQRMARCCWRRRPRRRGASETESAVDAQLGPFDLAGCLPRRVVRLQYGGDASHSHQCCLIPRMRIE